MKILIVDDSKAMRMIVRRTLRQAGFGDHAVIEANNGKEALENIRQSLPDLVLSDWNMPEMSGIELLDSLRAEGIKVTFGFVTTERTPEMRVRAAEAGASFLIVKPFTPEDFKDALTPLVR
jgi:two-component system, chemotaxis family, chemotaxis protein CheY